MNFVQEQLKIVEPFYFENIFLKTLVLRMVLGVDDISHRSSLIKSTASETDISDYSHKNIGIKNQSCKAAQRETSRMSPTTKWRLAEFD